MCISVNNDFAALQYGQENRLVFVFSLWYSAPRSLALEVFKSLILLPILLLQQLPQHPCILYQVCDARGATGVVILKPETAESFGV